MVSQRDWASPPNVEPLPYRLLDAAELDTGTGHWKLGAQFMPDYCGQVLHTSAACVTGTGFDKDPLPNGVPTRASDPFPVYAWIDCALTSMNEEELRTRTTNALKINGQTTVENVFWTGGDFGVSPHLASDTEITEVVGGSTVVLQTAATVITGTYDVVEAIGLLEEAMSSCYGGTPFIHVPRRATPHLNANYLIKESGARLKTIGNGSIVVPGPGYALTGPDGTPAPAGHAWFYATGKVKYWQSPVIFRARDVREFLNRNTNDTVLIAEQWYMLGWDCCHYAILVNLGGVITGTPASAT